MPSTVTQVVHTILAPPKCVCIRCIASQLRGTKIWANVHTPKLNPHTSETQGCYRYFPKVSPIFDIDAGFKSIFDTDIDTLP